MVGIVIRHHLAFVYLHLHRVIELLWPEIYAREQDDRKVEVVVRGQTLKKCDNSAQDHDIQSNQLCRMGGLPRENVPDFR